MKILRIPEDLDSLRSLKIGEVVYISGPIITGRDEMHMRALEYAREGKPVPRGVNGAVLYHCGPIVSEKDGKRTIVSAGPTTSARMNKLEPEMIERFGIKAIIGKGGMSSETAQAMKANGCVYLAAVGGTAVSLAECLTNITGAEWEDLGMAEAMWSIDADKLGPLIVAMDCRGDSLYENVRKSLVRDI